MTAVDLPRVYPLPKRRARRDDFDWCRPLPPAVRMVGLLLLDASIFLVALAVALTVGFDAVEHLILLWRR